MHGEETTPNEGQRAGGKDHPVGGTSMCSSAAGLREVTYRVTGAALFYRYGLLGALTLVGAVLFYLLAPMSLSARDYLVLGILGIWALALLRYWVYMLDMPYRILRKGDGMLVFVSVFRRRTVPESSILTLKVSPIYPGYLRIRTDRKKNISILNHVDGMNELIAGIRAANPGLVTRGC